MRALAYSDPRSGREVLCLLLSDRILGVAYDPRSTKPPVPWSSECPHCRAGKQDLPPATRQEISFLSSRISFLSSRSSRSSRLPYTRITYYRIPTAAQIKITHWRERDCQHVLVVASRENAENLLVAKPRGKNREIRGGDPRCFQSPVLWRCLQFLWSERRCDREEVAALLEPLARAQRSRDENHPRPRRGRPRKQIPCREIDWESIVRKMT